MTFRRRWFRLCQRLKAAVQAKAFRRSSDEVIVAAALFALSGRMPKRIMVFGDSNASRPGGGKMCWAARLAAKVPVHLSVYNESCDGRTTQYDTGERNGLAVIKDKLTSHAPLDYVIVSLGTNDMKSQYGPPSVTDIADGMCQILDFIEAEAHSAKPLLMTPPPLGHVTSGDLAGAQSRISSIAVEYRLLATNRGIRLIDIHSILDSRTDLGVDRIHLNASGRQKVADAVWENLAMDFLQDSNLTSTPVTCNARRL